MLVPKEGEAPEAGEDEPKVPAEEGEPLELGEGEPPDPGEGLPNVPAEPAGDGEPARFTKDESAVSKDLGA